MKQSLEKGNKKWVCLMIAIMMLQLVVASYFCIQKQGFHYDEYYSYYSSNVTYGLAPGDRQWKDAAEIKSEFQVQNGEGFRYGMVKTMQSFDVHPPLYYMILHTVCSLFPGIFSKWFGLGLNLFFFALCYMVLWYVAYHVFHENKTLTMITCLLFGFQTGVLSGITFIRMYMLLSLWCFLLIAWHVPVWEKGIRLTVKNSLGLFLLVLLGFLTHYYYAVFLFFLAAYNCLYHWWVKKDLKTSVLYGSVICSGMLAAVIYYPSCLSHIFRGYRGTEATGAFFDLGNTIERLEFFTELMNQSVFGGGLWMGLLIVLLLTITKFYGNRNAKKERLKEFFHKNQGLVQIGFVTLGYFFVVAKTALLNAEEANRYELPVYGFCMLLMVASVFYLGNDFWVTIEKRRSSKNRSFQTEKLAVAAAGMLVTAALILQVVSFLGGKVQFLYSDDLENVQWAKEHEESTIVYLYNPNNVWMIWDEAEELMQYKEIYFANLQNDAFLEDEKLQKAKEIYVYTSRMEQAEMLMEDLIKKNPDLNTKVKIRELLYCDLYYLK